MRTLQGRLLGAALLFTGAFLLANPRTSFAASIASFADEITLHWTGSKLAIKDGGIGTTQVATANKDGTSGTPSMRTLGTGAQQAAAGNDSRLSDARTPVAHAATHKSGGTDPIKLDELALPTDVTTLNVSTGQHGLAPKLDGNAAHFLNGTGSYTTPAGGGGGGDALTSNPLSQFASTTSAQLAGVLSDEQGTGAVVMKSYVDGLKLDTVAAPTDVTTLNASTGAHGLLPKLDNNSAHFLNGQGGWTTPAGGGNALTSSPLSQFAATSSSQFFGVI